MSRIGIEELIPSFILGDRNGYALAKAVERMLEMFQEAIDEGLAALKDIDRMPEWRLDELAWEMNVFWYDHDASIAIKRAQLKGAQDYYMRLGTPAAVERALSDIYGSGRVEEWNEYGGEPYYFKVYTTDPQVANEKRERFLQLLESVKNVRSVLDEIIYVGAEGATEIFAATAAAGVYSAGSATAKAY